MSYDYDFLVIGGGSGGMAAAKEAAKFGAKVAMFDYVKPSTRGTAWGLGGTCVNVGCIPKKLMHYSSLISPILHQDAPHLGWKVPENISHDWNTMVETIQNYIKSLNFSYRTGLRSAKVNYINAHAHFLSPHEVSYTLKGESKSLSAKYILIATGGRPTIPPIPGHHLAISSDDLFSLPYAPGKTLVVGASYIALECAGFLTKLGFDTTVAVRSILLRGFDRQCAEKIGEMMAFSGTKFLHSLPTSLSSPSSPSFPSPSSPFPLSSSPSPIEVTFDNGHKETFDTVLYAIGRTPDLHQLSLSSAGVLTNAQHKIPTNDQEQTNVPHIYAVGDVLAGRPELTPVAIRTGELLAQRLFNHSTKTMDWDFIPTTVFTPYEYGVVGLSEEDAVAKYGEEDVEVYLYEWTTLEHSSVHRKKHPSAYVDEMDADMPGGNLTKLVCVRSLEERVVGFHYVGMNAGEVTQGFALALRLGAKKKDFDEVIGIHPTDAESLTYLNVTRRSGQSWVAAGGCGGGKCG